MSLSAIRREAVELLCAAQADGRISEAVFEMRLAAVHQAVSDAAVQAIVADLVDHEPDPWLDGAAPDPGPPPVPFAEELRVSAVLSSTRREGNWVMPWRLELLTIMGDLKVDFREALVPEDILTVNVNATLGSVVLVVPRGTAIRNDVEAILGSTELKRKKGAAPPSGLTLHVTGRLVLSSLEIRES